MLRVIMSVSAEGAGNYFDVALKKSDYYAKEPGVWGGKGAERLGLEGEVTREEFLGLASNEVPGTGENLTVRTKDKRTAGYDFCYSVPKSVSVYLALSGDRAVERMIDQAFRETMAEAGFLSVREMRQLLSFAADNNCRVILSGDSLQHHAVQRGDALRILEKSAAIRSVALTKIFRQQIPALRAELRAYLKARPRKPLISWTSSARFEKSKRPMNRVKPSRR